MAINDAYATPAEYRVSVDKLDAADDPLIATHLLACSRLFERETGQFFTRDDEPVARLFRAKWSDRLDLDYEGNCPGIADIAGDNAPVIKVDTDGDGSFADETAWSASDYQLEPLQAMTGAEQRPYSRICIPRGGSRRFITGNLVEVTAVWGWPSVPAAVKADIIELCGIWRGENPRATGRMGELDQVVATSPMAMSLVRRIRDAYSAKVTF